ncbi:GMC family oxidoreductase [Mycolicibacterium sp. YH-1]|uniref:GMC family oxidoreductase n=1 Tax=Mycolicibacterium sp. YH-1 TaxID=2908837 RepID=UPI001F4C2E02|nr:GMC family oxidoreductase [Mycolicibacterium sp. YH-1]UNB55325.1 GMC family oxidoreductase [Mycolicibacterium sp. YH-1]
MTAHHSGSAEFLVVGGGTAGCVVAARLLSAGHQVTLLEAGPDHGTLAAGNWPADLLDAAALPVQTHDWGYSGVGAGGQPLAFERAKVMGGCSSHNGCTQTVGWAGDYDGWAADSCPGWDAASLREDFDRAGATLRLRQYSEDEIQPFHRGFIGLCVEAGLPYRHDLHQLDGRRGVGCAPVNSLDGVRFNTSFAYLDDLRSHPRLTVVDRATVDTLIVEGSAVRGARYLREGRVLTIRVDHVVLCAGAFGSPEILLRTGIGPADHLSGLGIPVLLDRPGVGSNLHEHPTVQLEYAATAGLADALTEFASTQWLPEEQTIAKLTSPFSDGPFDLHVYPWVEPDRTIESGWRVVFPISQLRPRSRGSVRLRSADPMVRAVIDPGFLTDPEGADIGSLRFGLEWVMTHVVAKMTGRILERPLHDLAEHRDVDAWIRGHHTHYWHPAGSCRMGSSADPMSVVRHDGGVIGLDGLAVADASIFPTIPRATPALPTVVVAERVSRFLLGEALAVTA